MPAHIDINSHGVTIRVELQTPAGAANGFAGSEPHNVAAGRSSNGRTLDFFVKHL